MLKRHLPNYLQIAWECQCYLAKISPPPSQMDQANGSWKISAFEASNCSQIRVQVA